MFNPYMKNIVYIHNDINADENGRAVYKEVSRCDIIGFIFTASHEYVNDVRFIDVTDICVIPPDQQILFDFYMLRDNIIANQITYKIIDYDIDLHDNHILYLKRMRA